MSRRSIRRSIRRSLRRVSVTRLEILHRQRDAQAKFVRPKEFEKRHVFDDDKRSLENEKKNSSESNYIPKNNKNFNTAFTRALINHTIFVGFCRRPTKVSAW